MRRKKKFNKASGQFPKTSWTRWGVKAVNGNGISHPDINVTMRLRRRQDSVTTPDATYVPRDQKRGGAISSSPRLLNAVSPDTCDTTLSSLIEACVDYETDFFEFEATSCNGDITPVEVLKNIDAPMLKELISPKHRKILGQNMIIGHRMSRFVI